MDYKINKNLKRYRLIANLTQEELANKVGITKQYLSRIERNISTPTLEVIVKFSETLNIPIEYFIECDERVFKELTALIFADRLNDIVDKIELEHITKLLKNNENCE